MNENQTTELPHNHRAGTIAGIVFIALLFLLGLYLYGAYVDQRDALNAPAEPEIFEMTQTNTESDAIADIEADLEAFNPSQLETEDDELEAEFEASN